MYLTIVLFLLLASITRLFFVTKGNLTLVFQKGVNSIRANKSSAPVPTRCLLFLVTNGNLTLVFHMEVNSIRAYKLSAIVYRILDKKAFISKLFLRLCSSSL